MSHHIDTSRMKTKEDRITNTHLRIDAWVQWYYWNNMMKKKLVVDWRNNVETRVYQQLSSYFCIKTKRETVKKNQRVFSSSWYVLLVTLFYRCVYTSIVRVVWCGCVKISLPSSLFIYLFLASLLRLLFEFFFVQRCERDDVRWTYIHIYIRKCKICVCSFCTTVYVTRRFTLCIHPRK